MTEGKSSRDDLEASVAARRELGPDYEDAILDSFLERLDRSIAARVDARVSDQIGRGGATAVRPEDNGGRDNKDPAFVLAVVSLCVGIPITAISAAIADLPGLAVAWLGIAAVNVAHAWGVRRAG